MKQSFIKRMSLLAVLLVMTLGAFAQVGNSLALLTSTNTSPIEHQTTQTRADVLYNNDVPTTTSGLISVYWAGSDALVQIADDFIGGEGWIIEKVVTSGFCNANPIPTVYGIVFYTDDNGKPGTELYKNITCQGVVVGSDIEITLPTAYTLPSTGKFWISIYGVRTQVQDFNWRFDIYTSTTAVGSPLYLKDHKNVFGSGTEWMPVSPGLISGVVSMKFSLYGTRPTILIPVPGELFAIEEEANAAHLIWEPLVSENLTGYEVRRKLVSETDWDLADVIATSLPAAQKEYMDYTWGAADYGVYHWAVIASYSDIADARLVSNTLDKDMITEVDVTVTLNSGESAAGVEVTFTNTSEPDLDLVYQTSLPATGKFSWDEFRKGTYDVVVKYPGFTMITETDELIVEETSFIWLMEEKLTEAIDLYVTPTAFASWSAPVFTPFHETFDNGLPSTWTVENNGNKPAGAWTALTQYSYYGTNYSLNSTPFVMADSDAAGYGSVCDELLISPVMNVSMCDELFLSFIQYYRHLGATAFSKVQVFDGNEWVTVLNQTATVGSWASPNVQEINVTEYINSAFQVRFHYTGNWAYYWAIDDVMITAVPTKDRSLVQYKVYLNDVFVTNTTETSYQFDVANLTVGQSYVAEVMADYTTGQAERVSYEFTYLGCDAYDALTALAVTQPVGTKNAALTWTNPDLTDVDFLRVYRNGDLYRDNLSMDTPFSTWTDVTLDNGTYNYALTLVYDDGAETCLDAATTSITIKSTGTINGTVTYALGGNVQGATITVSNTDNTYTFTTAAAGTYTGTVEAGTYEVKCEFAGHVSQTTNATIAYVGTTSIDFSIYETPVAVDNVLAWVENGAVTVSWDGSGPPQGENIVEDVESHTAFTVNSPGTIGWSYIDGDGNPTYGFSGISFPGSAGAMAFIVFDPKLTSPEMYTTTPGIHAHSGDKFFGSFAANPAPNNDWIVSPELSSPTKISFWAKTYMPDYGLERMKVGYSTTGTAQSDFTFVTGSSYVSVPSDAWTFYEYDLPANAKYAAINCVSNDAFIFMVDDITIELAAGKSINLSANNYNPTVKSDALIPEVAQRGKLGQKYEQVSVPSTPAKGTRALAGYEVYRNDCYEGEAELLASLP
ncbi:choice-of-anchor J domain-containing protein, partial [Odoribacter sp. OttesenSCG-928-L07]|nr:choice-of-anchor J domain-containing protein [Odoribacter sp. OttesenSCG-928-L07]